MEPSKPELTIQTATEAELAARESTAIRQVPAMDPVERMIQAVIEKGTTAENVAVMEKLVGLYERMQDKDAEKQFAAAFVALQRDLSPVRATKPVPGNNGEIRYKFAPYEAIMGQVRPLIDKHGFTLTFSMSVAEGRITQTCHVQHASGHIRSNQFTVRVGKGPPGSSEAQADGASATYAKRQALCDALNIVIEHDVDGADAKDEGAPITFEQAQYLREQVMETNSDEGSFLRFAGANKYEEIGSKRYDSLVAALEKKKAN